MVLYLPRDVTSVPVSRQILDGCLQTLGVTPDTRGDIALALDEACANVIQHAGPGEEYEVEVTARNGQCVIEVLNTGPADGEPSPQASEPRASEPSQPVNGTAPDGTAPDGTGTDGAAPDAIVLTDDPVPLDAEHGRGLKIIDAVVDHLQLTGNERHGTTVRFDKALEWLPGAAGQHLFDASAGG